MLKANKKGLAGATGYKEIIGYGASSVIHSHKYWEVGEKGTLAMKIINDRDKIVDFLNETSMARFATTRACISSCMEVCLADYEKELHLFRVTFF